MYIFYDLVFLLILFFYLPIYLFKGKFHPGFSSRLGFIPKNLTFDRPIWIHAVSVGEAIMVKGLLENLRLAYPGKKFVISTVTPTGNKIAKGLARDGDWVTYLPLDFSFIVKKVLSKISPSLFIIAETELWPNLIACLHKNNIPVIIVNGRVSDSSFKGYSRIKFWLKPTLDKVNVFSVQTQRDKDRLTAIGVAGDKIQVGGNMKFDLKLDIKQDYFRVRLRLGLKDKDKLLVCGSTHPQEEGFLLAVYQNLIKIHPGLKLLIAPRHPERALEIEKVIIKYGFRSEKVCQLAGLPVSQLNRPTGQPANRPTVFILDTVGELMNYYAVADIVFVGGSLIKKGGHNILEPAVLGKPILFGPYMFNFRQIAELFLENQAAILVHDSAELSLKINILLKDQSLASGLSRAAQELIRQNQGATLRTFKIIQSLIK